MTLGSKRGVDSGARPPQIPSAAQPPSSFANGSSRIFKPVDIKPQFLGKTVAKFSTKIDTQFSKPRKLLIPKSRKPAGYQRSMPLSGQSAMRSDQQMPAANAITGSSILPKTTSSAPPPEVRLQQAVGEGSAKRRGTSAAPGSQTLKYVPIYEYPVGGWRRHGGTHVEVSKAR